MMVLVSMKHTMNVQGVAEFAYVEGQVSETQPVGEEGMQYNSGYLLNAPVGHFMGVGVMVVQPYYWYKIASSQSANGANDLLAVVEVT